MGIFQRSARWGTEVLPVVRPAPMWLLLAWLSLGLSQWMQAQPSAETIPSAWQGTLVVAVEVRGPVGEELAGEIEAAVAERVLVLTRESIRSALSIAHSRISGGDIEAWVRPANAQTGVHLVIAIGQESTIGAVEITGIPNEVAGWQPRVLVKSGDRLVENRLLRTIYGLEEAMEDAGYLDAQVALSVKPMSNAQLAVGLTAKPGPRFQVVQLEVDPALPEDVESPTKMVNRVGEPYQRRKIGEDEERFRRQLVNQGYRSARVAAADVERVEPDAVTLRFPIVAGPKVEIQIEGFDVSKLRKKNRLPVLREQGFDPALVPATERTLRDFMQSKGFYQAQIGSQIAEEDDLTQVVFSIVPGEKRKLAAVSIDGASTFASERLSNLLLTEKGRPLVDSELAEDLNNLRSFYVRQGFLQAQVEADVAPTDGQDRPGQLVVTITVNEGPRSVIRSLQISGANRLAEVDLVKNLPTSVNGPFHESIVREGVAEIQRRYRQRGFRSSIVTAEVEAVAQSPQQVDVEYRILEGPAVHVGEVFLRGLSRTRPGFVRKVLGLEPGDLLSSDRLLSAERRLFQLGLFSEVDVRSSPAAPFSDSEDLIVEVKEAPVHRLSYGLGWDTEDELRGVAGYTRNNWLGRGFSWNLDAAVSAKEKLFRVILTQPWIGVHQTPLTYSLFRLDENRESFQLRRAGVQVGARQQRGRTQAGLLLTWRQNKTSDDAFNLDREIASVEIASMTPSLFVDRRNDPFNPTRGWSGLVQVEKAFSLLGSQEEFLKLFGQYTQYLNLGAAGTLGSSVRVGWINPGATEGLGRLFTDLDLLPPGLESAEVHISERFVSGGRSSHRAYGRFELGQLGETLLLCDQLPADGRSCSPDEILPVGGNALGLINLDWRFPIAGALGGVAFVDAGNLWADWSHADLDQLKLGAGIGFRYSSPIGPLRLEVGWKLDREPFEDPYVIFFSLGNPF